MTEQPMSIPTAWQLVLSEAGTSTARWVLQQHHAELGVIAEGAWSASGAVPDAAMATWVAECLEVTGTDLVPTDEPTRWAVRITS